MQALMPNILKTYSSNSGSSEEGPSGRLVIVGSGVHDPDEPGGNVGSKAKLGDMSGLERGFTPPDSMVDGAAFDSDKAYKDSKLCNVVTCLEMARRLSSDSKYKGITCNVMNPGLCPTTGLFRDLNPIFVAIFTLITRYLAKVAVSEEEGGKRLAYMVEGPLLDKVTGGYFSGKPGYYEFEATTPSKEARSESTGKRLFDLTEGLVKKYM
jgi:protochlorophyllide reductase